MSTAAALIATELGRSFPHRRPDDLGPISDGDREENIRLRADLATVTDWTTLLPERVVEIDRRGGFGFLAKKAARFYLPAFLVADLRGEALNSDPIFHLCTFDPSISTDELIAWQIVDLRDRWDALTMEQAAAICRYLEWRVVTQLRGNERAAAHSLATYWYRRAQPPQPSLGPSCGHAGREPG